MKRLFLLSVLVVMYGNLNAQESEGGQPLSMNPSYGGKVIPQSDRPQILLQAPDIAALIAEDQKNAEKPLAPARIGACIASDISFPNSGMLLTQADGKTIWVAQVKVSGAAALGMYYDQFHLPDGVKYFIYNENNKQILGAYTSSNNPADGLWVTDKVQGELMNLELDIDEGVDINAIQMHVNNVADFYRSTGYLAAYASDASSTNTASKTTGTWFTWDGSSTCELNAKCSIGNAYSIQRRASIAIQYPKGSYIYAGSGTLMNNTRQDCTPYVLTASHVEPTNSKSSGTFAQWQFYFLYETPTCTYAASSGQPSYYSTIGATFKARSSYDSANQAIVGDFLLLKLGAETSPIVAHDSAYFAGWNIATTAGSGTYTGFHHPMGDVKKVSNTTSVSAFGSFNGGGINTHWQLNWANGGIEEGSSGSGLFDPNGRLIGDLTGAQPPNVCKVSGSFTMSTVNVEYSKLTLNWLYAYQSPSDSTTHLKYWLDPTNSGVTILDAIPVGCTSTAVTQPLKTMGGNSVTLYPNPTNGIAYADVSINDEGGMKIEVLNMLGEKVGETVYAEAIAGRYKIDMSIYAAGVYLVRVSTKNNSLVDKILLSK